MPTHTEIYTKAGRCSYSQTWVPTLVPDGAFLNRGSLAVLASETLQQPLFTEVLPQPLDFDSQISWLDKCFKQQGAPAEILVPTEKLAEALAPRCPASQIVVDPSPPVLVQLRNLLFPPEMEFSLYSIVRMMGEKKALDLYLDAEDFLHLELWKSIQDDEVFRFTSRGREYGVLVGGSTRFQDSGVAIYSSVKETIKHTTPPKAAFGPGGPATLHHQDLNFLVRHEVQLPRQKHPMFVLDLKDKNGSLKDLRWLLQQLPELARTGEKVVESGKRRLERTDLRVKEGRSGLFPAYWDESRVA